MIESIGQFIYHSKLNESYFNASKVTFEPWMYLVCIVNVIENEIESKGQNKINYVTWLLFYSSFTKKIQELINSYQLIGNGIREQLNVDEMHCVSVRHLTISLSIYICTLYIWAISSMHYEIQMWCHRVLLPFIVFIQQLSRSKQILNSFS